MGRGMFRAEVNKKLSAKIAAAVRQAERHPVAFYLNPHTMHATKLVLNGRNEPTRRALDRMYELIGVYRCTEQDSQAARRELYELILDDLCESGAVS